MAFYFSLHILCGIRKVNGKPRIVTQKYLGRAERIAQAFEEGDVLETPKYSIVQEFGVICALYELAAELGLVALIDRHCHKRGQGLSVGQYMLLAAINRAVEPVSKSRFADWYEKTVLHRLIPAQKSLLSLTWGTHHARERTFNTIINSTAITSRDVHSF